MIKGENFIGTKNYLLHQFFKKSIVKENLGAPPKNTDSKLLKKVIIMLYSGSVNSTDSIKKIL
jgi:hypothetical protein